MPNDDLIPVNLENVLAKLSRCIFCERELVNCPTVLLALGGLTVSELGTLKTNSAKLSNFLSHYSAERNSQSN